jgi:hypothetical protein
MKFLPVVFVVLIAGCSGGSGTSTSQGPAQDAAQGVASAWPTKWCQARPGISKEQLVSIMGQPTHAFPTQMSWSDDHYQFNAFLEQDGTVRQLDINKASLTDAEKAALQCSDVRTQRSMAAQSSAPPAQQRPTCEIVSQAEMSAILGAPVIAQPSGRSKCIYQSSGSGASGPYVEFSFDRGDGAAGMAGAGFAGKHEPGLTSPYDGIGDQAVAAGPALFIRTGDDLVTLVFSGVKDPRTAAKKILETAKPRT